MSTGKPRKIGPDTQKQAMQMLADGWTITSVAAHFGIIRKTLYIWRDNPANAQFLEEARKQRELDAKDAQASSRRILRMGAIKAALAMVDALDAPTVANRIQAAKDILDRIGVLRGEVINLNAKGHDTSKLSDEELEAYGALIEKMRDHGG